MNHKLRKCECGSRNVHVTANLEYGGYEAMCRECWREMWGKTPAEAAKAWNTMPVRDNLLSGIAALRKQLDEAKKKNVAYLSMLTNMSWYAEFNSCWRAESEMERNEAREELAEANAEIARLQNQINSEFGG